MTVYVCSIEPYHDNSTIVGVAATPEGARALLGVSDRTEWHVGPVTGQPNVTAWHALRGDGETVQIVRFEVGP